MIVQLKDRVCENIVQAVDVGRKYSLGLCEHQALLGVNFNLKKNDFAAIAGPSGSGKSTLLNILGCLERPSNGDVLIEGISTQKFNTFELAEFRAHRLGFIFQTFNLIPTLSALENVEYPLLLLKLKAKDRRLQAEEALVKVGLEKFLKSRPNEMSGGQRQRVAIARAIVKKPVLILADEPTANLDQKTAREILDLMQRLNVEDGISVLFSSHDGEVLKRASSVTYLVDGQVWNPKERGNLLVA
ncbi:MAG: ABC transporter ATP-binding protein [Deltaproteobacteria bacterium]|nr:ABC transporter ATP-binding protein [Deltaproteobacteria bacterium]